MFASIQQQGSLKHQSAFRIELVKHLFVCLGSCIAWWLVCIYLCQTALKTGWKTIDSKGHKTSMCVLCVLQHRECKRTAPRRGSKTISPKVKKTPLINLGCLNVSTCTESGAAHTSQSIQTALVQHTIAPTQSYREFTQSVDNKTIRLCCVWVCSAL